MKIDLQVVLILLLCSLCSEVHSAIFEQHFDIFSPYDNTRCKNVHTEYGSHTKIDSSLTSLLSSLDETTSLSNKMIPLKTGTTIVGLCCRDGIVLGADTRSTGGPLVMDKNKLKIHKIANLIYCCAAGTSADCDHITREAAHLLSLLRLENELSLLGTTVSTNSDIILYDPIPAALQCIFKSLQTPRSSNQMKSSVMIVGGVDDNGPSLYMVDADGVPTKVSFAALGSGSTDAIAILENFLFHHYRKSIGISNNKNSTSNDRQHDYSNSIDNSSYSSCVADICVSEGIAAVREAVAAGILNDLGSGSHIDLCVIEQHGATHWREESNQQQALLLYSHGSIHSVNRAKGGDNLKPPVKKSDDVPSTTTELLSTVVNKTCFLKSAPHHIFGKLILRSRKSENAFDNMKLLPPLSTTPIVSSDTGNVLFSAENEGITVMDRDDDIVGDAASCARVLCNVDFV